MKRLPRFKAATPVLPHLSSAITFCALPANAPIPLQLRLSWMRVDPVLSETVVKSQQVGTEFVVNALHIG